MSEQSITNVEDAVAALGALPMPSGPVPLPLSAERLAEIEARAAAATAGPWCADSWEIYQGSEYLPGLSFWIGETCRGTSTPEQDCADAAFVAAARSDVPAMVAELAVRQDEVAAAVGYTSGLEWSDLVGIVASNTTSLVQAGRDVRALRARVAELEALTPAAIQTCRVCGAGYSYGQSCSTCAFRSQMAAELQVRGLAGEHEASVHHSYRVGHDLPETGGVE